MASESGFFMIEFVSPERFGPADEEIAELERLYLL